MRAKKDEWSSDMEQLLRDGWARGDSKATIVATIGMGVTRNAVGGKAMRLNLGPHPNSKISPDTVHRVANVRKYVAKSQNSESAETRSAPGKPSMPRVPISRFTY